MGSAGGLSQVLLKSSKKQHYVILVQAHMGAGRKEHASEDIHAPRKTY